jgi:hypothetical protein
LIELLARGGQYVGCRWHCDQCVRTRLYSRLVEFREENLRLMKVLFRRDSILNEDVRKGFPRLAEEVVGTDFIDLGGLWGAAQLQWPTLDLLEQLAVLFI